jgi:hypothetical protein
MDPRVKPEDDNYSKLTTVIPRLDRGTHLLKSPVTIHT